jgi:putative ABC transport system permease protein
VVTEDDAWAIQREVPLVEAAAPMSWARVYLVRGNQNWVSVLLGVTPEYLPVRSWDVLAGRAITPSEFEGAAKVVLIGLTVAEQLFGDEDPVGQVIRVQRIPFTVVGVLARKGQTTWGQDQDDHILVPLSTARRNILGRTPGKRRVVGSITMKIRAEHLMQAAEQEIRGLLRQRHRLQPHQEDDFTLRNQAEVRESHEASSRVLTSLLAAIASISLLIGGVGIMNIMLVSVAERTREIGLRMAVGARPRDIAVQFLVEAVTLSLVGGLVGIGLGLAASHTIGYLAQWRTIIQPQAVVMAFAFAAVVGVASGFYPARKAARVQPIDALRHE